MCTEYVYRVSYVEEEVYLLPRLMREIFEFPPFNTEVARKDGPVEVIKIVEQELRHIKKYLNVEECFVINASLQWAPSGCHRSPYPSRSGLKSYGSCITTLKQFPIESFTVRTAGAVSTRNHKIN